MTTEQPASSIKNVGADGGWRVIFKGVMGARRHASKAAAETALAKIEKGLAHHEPIADKWFRHKDPRLIQ